MSRFAQRDRDRGRKEIIRDYEDRAFKILVTLGGYEVFFSPGDYEEWTKGMEKNPFYGSGYNFDGDEVWPVEKYNTKA